MGRVRKGVKCSVAGCDERAVRSISVNKLGPLASRVKLGRGVRRAYLCERHYKEWKRLTKKSRQLELLRYR